MTRDLRKKLLSGEPLDRREFTSASVMALLAGVTVTITSCSSGNNNPAGPSNPGGDGDVVGAVSANHGHTAVVDSARLDAGNAYTLTMGGDADHPHTVQITMTDLMQIAAGTRVTKTSSQDTSPSTGPHTHVVTFN